MPVKVEAIEALEKYPEAAVRLQLQEAYSLRTLAKRVLPKAVQDLIRGCFATVSGVHEYARDFGRYLRHSAALGVHNEANLRGRIIAQYHVIEKGLSHHDRRPGFGREMVCSLVSSLRAYLQAGYSTSCSQYRAALGALESYYKLHRGGAEAVVPLELKMFLDEVAETAPGPIPRGYDVKTGKELVAAWRGDFRSLATSRHSIRHFSSMPVDQCAVLRAIEVARHAPSACNRQPGRVSIIRDKNAIEAILGLQGGARGFIELIDTLLYLSVDLRGYFGLPERNLPYVDGGLFAMALSYALCYEGIGSCLLNLAMSSYRDKRIRRFVGLPDSYVGVVMLAIGNLPDTLKVAHSERRPLGEYLAGNHSRSKAIPGNSACLGPDK